VKAVLTSITIFEVNPWAIEKDIEETGLKGFEISGGWGENVIHVCFKKLSIFMFFLQMFL